MNPGVSLAAEPMRDLRHNVGTTPESAEWPVLAVLTSLALVLRLPGLGSDLWLDEIGTVLDCLETPTLALWTEFRAGGRHLLNSLQIEWLLALGLYDPAAGHPPAWLVRLPALLLGTATVPAVYFLARASLGHGASRLAAFLVAVSYHHVFFSQSARGYAGFLFFACLGTGCLLRAVQARDRVLDAASSPGSVQAAARRWWIGWAVAMSLAAATLLLAVFVVAGQLLVVAVLWWRARARDGAALPQSLSIAQPLAAALGFCLAMALVYGPIVPAWWSYLRPTYTSEALGFAAFSVEHVRVWVEGLAAGFGGAAAILVFAVAALVAGVLLLRALPLLTCTLFVPMALQGSLFLALGLRISPRFFLWLLPASFVAAAAVAEIVGRRAPRTLAPFAMPGLALVMLGLAGLSLPRAYRVPKQPCLQSLEWVAQERRADEAVATAYLAKWCARYYGPALNLREGRDFVAVHEAAELPESPGVWLLTTFETALAIEYPDLWHVIDQEWEPVREFPATVRDAEVRVWRRRTAPDSRERSP